MIILLITSILLGLIIIKINYTYTPKYKDVEKQLMNKSFAKLEEIKLGNIRQTILIRGRNTDNPVILFLHGGPGSPDMPMIRHYCDKLEDDFIVVTWDQRGCGKSFNKNMTPDSLSLEHFLCDTIELIEYLKQKFNKQKINLVGHSWGTILGLKTVLKYPESINCYVSISQVVDMRESERYSYNFAKEVAQNKSDVKLINQLEDIGEPVDGAFKGGVKDMLKQRAALLKLGGVLYEKQSYKLMITAYNKAKETGLKDMIVIKKSSELSLQALWKDVLATDFIQQEIEFKVPVCFISGQHDQITPSYLIKSFYDHVSAPQKDFYMFENSAHFPYMEEADKFMNIVIKHCKIDD